MYIVIGILMGFESRCLFWGFFCLTAVKITLASSIKTAEGLSLWVSVPLSLEIHKNPFSVISTASSTEPREQVLVLQVFRCYLAH